ncbi:MAG: YlbF family regulator [Clostridiales bacterium]|nr:YlbF family regulator [Clostridiales bacterium]
MEVIKKAKELAEEIIKTQEYIMMNSAQEAVDNDEDGAGLIQDMELLQQEYMKSAREGTTEEDLKMLEDILKSKHAEIMEYKPTAHMIKSKAAFDRLIATINKEITSGITGCATDDCSGCSGCN